MPKEIKTEVQSRKKHLGHVLLIKEIPTSIGVAKEIACEKCKTGWLDVSDYDNW